MGRNEDTLGVLSPRVGRAGVNRLGNTIPVFRVHKMRETDEDHGAGDSGHVLVDYDRESSVFMKGLSLGTRGSCTVSTSAAVVPVVRGSIACHLKRRMPWDEHGCSRQYVVDAGSGCNGPECEVVVLCCNVEPLAAVILGK